MTATTTPAYLLRAADAIEGGEDVPIISRMRLRMLARKIGDQDLLGLLAESEESLLGMAQEAERTARDLGFDPAATRFHAEHKMLLDLAVLREELMALDPQPA